MYKCIIWVYYSYLQPFVLRLTLIYLGESDQLDLRSQCDISVSLLSMGSVGLIKDSNMKESPHYPNASKLAV
jgi:hypothetical protein